MSYSDKLSTHYLQLAKTPVSEESFVGIDSRYSSEFERLETELGKATSLYETGTTDWEQICDSSEALLASQSKDLRVAAWLIWGLYQRESYAGLLAGINLLHYLCLNHWPDLHPRKPRTRTAAISWLLPRLEQALAEHVPISEQLPLFRSLAKQLRALEACLSEHLGADVPLLLPICRQLDELVKRSSQDQPTPGSVGSAIAQVRQAATQMLSPGAQVDNEKDAHKHLRNLQDIARPLCAYWLKQKVSDLRALRLARTLLWLPIDTLPERNAEQVTALRGLPADKLVSYRERFVQAQYADLLVDLEASIARAPFWLDGQRLVWESLQALGATQAMREVEIQLALFLHRASGLEALYFHDGVPFADSDTRAWIQSHVMPHLQAPDTAPLASSSFTDGGQPAWDLALQSALPTLKKEGLRPAVQELKHGLATARGNRERFLWQFALARLCFAAKKYELAKTQLESLDQLLQSSGLSNWEPELVLDVLRLIYRCYELLPQNHAVRESKDEIHRRLCHLDLEVVLD